MCAHVNRWNNALRLIFYFIAQQIESNLQPSPKIFIRLQFVKLVISVVSTWLIN